MHMKKDKRMSRSGALCSISEINEPLIRVSLSLSPTVSGRRALTVFYTENTPEKSHKVEGLMRTFLQKGCNLAQ
jgi:hypothetical protein